MKSTVTELEDNKVKLSVEVEEIEFEPAVDAAFKKLARQVRLPGFRPGKVPRKVLESHFGKEVARGQAIEDAVPDFFFKAIIEHDVDFIAAPDYDITGGMEEGPLIFDATVEVRPQINVAGYDSLRVEVTRPEPTDEEIEARIDQIRGQFGELETVERAAGEGDHTTIDITGTHDGEEVEGLTANDYVYEVGTGAVVAEIDENLVGAKAGDILEFEAEHPDPEAEGSLSFRVLVKEVQEKVLPEVDDAFVADATEFETVDELRTDISDNLRSMKLQQANMMLTEGVATELGKLVDEQPPEALIGNEVHQRINDMAQRVEQQGIDFGQYLQMTGSSIDQFREQLHDPAEESVKVDLALRAVVVAENLQVDDADLDAEFETLAGQIGQPAADLRARIESAGQLSAVRSDLERRKAVDWLLERVEIVDENGESLDRSELEIPEPVADAEASGSAATPVADAAVPNENTSDEEE